MNLPSDEPKDGDFVAYLAQIERHQLTRLPSPPPAALGEASRRRLPAAAATARNAAKVLPVAMIGRFALGILGLFLLLVGVIGDGGLVSTLVGAFLIWRAARAISAEFGRAARNLRAQLARNIEATNRKSS